MKKIVVLLVILTLVITLASCEIGSTTSRLPYDIESWHEHSWDNWTHVYDETQVNLVCSVCGANVKSYPISEGLEIDENGVLVGRGTCTDVYIVVPQGVTAIGEGAFANTKDILGVLLPDTVTIIEDNAFKSCDGLQVINIPDGVAKIGEKAFHSCKSLIGVLIPHSVTIIGKQAFANCGYLEIIYYVGTESDWKNVEKGQNWDQGAGKHAVELKFVIGDDPVSHVHEWSKWVHSTKPTCSNEGVVTKSCSCGLEIEEVWPKAPHHIVNGMCTICQSAADGESSHLYSEAWRMEFVAPTETSKGYTMHYCTVDGCGYSYKSDEYSIMTEGKYVLNANDLDFMEPYSNHMGEVTVYNDVFAAYYFYQTKIDRSSNVFEDGFEGFRRINFQGPTRTAYIDNKLSFIRNCIAITTTGETTINLWAISGDVGRYIIILDANGNVVDSSEPAAEKNQVFIYQSKTLPAGTYFIGSYYSDTSGGNYIQKIEVEVGPEQNDVDGSQGLEYALNEDGQSYAVVGIGTCTDADLIIPSTYKDLPVTRIGEYAFAGCTFLRSVTINEGVTKIDRWALHDCTSLTTVNISSTVTYTGYATFVGCTSLININADENNEHYKSIDGNLYSKDEKTFIQYAIGKTNTSYEILDTVTCIASCAFECCTSLKSVIIPNGVTSIKQFAFASCTNLESIIIPDSVTSIAGWVFSHCTSLRSVTLSNSLTSIGNWAFQVCPNLIDLIIPDSVTNIDIGAFYLCNSLTIRCEAETQPSDWNSDWNYSNLPVVWNYKAASEGLEYALNEDGQSYAVVGIGTCTDADLIIPSTYKDLPVTRIGEYAFDGCTFLRSVTINEGVTSIGSYAFSHCTSLTSIDVETDNQYYKSIDGILYSKDEKTLVCYPSSKQDLMFVVPDSVENIKEAAFSCCTSLVSVTISDPVTVINDDTFWGCTSLANVTISSGVTYISPWAFHNCISLTNIEVNDNNKTFKSIDGNIYSKNENTLILYAAGKKDKSFIIPDSVVTIGYMAFDICPELTSITISDSVRKIRSYAFFACQSLTSITIPNSVTQIERGIFCSCKSLTSVTIPNSVTIISEQAFSECSSLTNIEIPDSVTSIGEDAFSNCTSLTSVEIGNSVTGIGYRAFAYCTSLTSVVIPDSVTSIGEWAFAYCTSLTSVTIGGSVTSIGDRAFNSCWDLTSIVIPDSVTSIGEDAFSGCDSLTSINFEGAVEQWNSIHKGSDWNLNTGDYTIYCTDGYITKDGTVTYYN